MYDMEENKMTMITPFRSKSLMERFFSDDWDTEALVHTPEIQVKRSETQYKVLAKLPGAKKEDVKVEMENGCLKISGKYEQKEEKNYENVHSEFRNYSEFQRVLSLDMARFDLEQIDANFAAGVLEVSLPLKEAEKARQISVKTA